MNSSVKLGATHNIVDYDTDQYATRNTFQFRLTKTENYLMNSTTYLDALLNLPGLYGAHVSRDGRWVAWTWFRAAPAADVYVAPTDGSRGPIRLTATPEDTFLVSWTPDSRSVIVEQDKGGNERVQLFRVDVAQPEVMVPLTEPDPNYFIRGGDLHPNGHWLVYGANLDVGTGDEIEQTWIYCHDLETGERRVLAQPEKGAYIVPELNTPGTHVLYSRSDRHPAGTQVWLVDIDGEADREILNVGADKKVYASWFPDGERAVVLAETGTHRRVGVWRLTDRSLTWLLDDPARNVERAFVPFNCAQIVVLEVQEARLRASLLDPATGVEMAFPDVLGNLQPIAPVYGAEDTWVGRYYSARHPTDVVRFSCSASAQANFVSLSRIWARTSLTAADFAPAEDFRWTSVDGLAIQGWLYRTEGTAKGTIVYVHGGPTSHSQDHINTQIQFFVKRGFNVLDPNYRGSTGFGLLFQEAIKVEGWGALEQADIRTGIEALIVAGIAEPGKVGITGTSYGGYSSWHAIVHFPLDVLAASAPICGMTDLVVDYENTRPDLRPYSEAMMGGSPAGIPERYYERSPINFVGNIRGRLLIVQGLQDPNVSPENVRVVEEALKAAGISYDVLAFEDEGHGISRPHNQKPLYLRLAEFFERAFSA